VTAKPRPRARAADFVPLLLGLVALAAGTAFGWDASFVEAVVTPPPVVRAALVGVAVVVGAALLAGGLRRIGAVPGSAAAAGLGTPDAPNLPTMVRGIRLVFLAIAAFAAAAGWMTGHPLPIVIALVIAGVDVLETTFLLLVVRRRGSAGG
jgi:hypothetical protein